jgi:hypothetical protein
MSSFDGEGHHPGCLVGPETAGLLVSDPPAQARVASLSVSPAARRRDVYGAWTREVAGTVASRMDDVLRRRASARWDCGIDCGTVPNHKAPSAALGALFVFREMVGVPRFERGTS